ncbi:MAG TPA: hypothetical protein PLG57_10645 [Bacteroidia bacterium]|jgi:hypothetical protein|nr:hypothetical protein [Bacteroidia bacterium]HQF28277.1 hypothetical protein [Bacteroidia bacterium]HQK98642.1 hypothetical protein [Bacteroidia bacterium]
MYFNPKEDALMRLTIGGDTRLSSLQSDFNNYFPYLKIEFFKIPHRIGEALAKNLIYDKNKMVRDCRLMKSEGVLEFSNSMTVSDFEDKFQKEFGLSVQVFRRSGNVWLETSATDSWTLEQQNSEGAELSSGL